MLGNIPVYYASNMDPAKDMDNLQVQKLFPLHAKQSVRDDFLSTLGSRSTSGARSTLNSLSQGQR